MLNTINRPACVKIYTPYIHTPIHIHMYLMNKLASQCSSKMTPSKHHLYVLLRLLLLICSYSTIDAASVAKQNTTVLCLPDQASSLLQLKRSLIDFDENLASWRAGSDCCHWKGITCDMASGRVISLDLGGFHMQGRRLDPALFNLTSLRNLSLAFIDFRRAQLPLYGFERLTNMIHLNFSETLFLGQILIGIARLKNLVTLDFSRNYVGLYLQEPSFETFMANLSNLRELRLDQVDISDGGSTWSGVLANSAPQLHILSLYGRGISGPIHPSFSRLRLLREIDLEYNELTGKVPEFFAEFSSLSILKISGTFSEGQFPAKIFQMKSLRTLSLSSNPSLFVCLPDFPVGSNLETLSLDGSNLACGIPPAFINLKYLKMLSISTIGVSNKLSLIHKLPSLSTLWLYGQDLETPTLSWIGNLSTLTSLVLWGYDFSQLAPSWIGNLKSLTSLFIMYCNFSGPIPHQIGNLTNLAELKSLDCSYNEQPLPSWIGNLTELTALMLSGCNLSGPIPSTLGNLMQLRSLQIVDSNLSGEIPKWLFALPALQFLGLSSNKLSGPLKDFPAQLSSRMSGIRLSMNQLTGPYPNHSFNLNILNIWNSTQIDCQAHLNLALFGA
ncbi:receptor-like protein kinase 5 isoform X2 [Brachypodium distachyon]|uniref:receptor-like protein kinase 5 isoform X2 n=1 Tax=Brachypodium distachyon TaxID=15368 RepID=UPI000D0DBBE8|nr:receptor-like protein kinase 5 isoform X2 [Brachypodium distachyon]|eukprot:XP_014753477.2 receptor-like protein kinase 5 isoform X2 [Brachypodium distachyon]